MLYKSLLIWYYGCLLQLKLIVCCSCHIADAGEEHCSFELSIGVFII